MTLTDDLEEHLSRVGALPFLFVGSGMSRRYLGLESWRQLLERFAEPLARPFDYYFSTAGGNLPGTASLMADEFHDIWWSSDDYEEQRERHRSGVKDKQSALKIAISEYIASRVLEDEFDDETLRAEVDSFSRAIVDGVITTNWGSPAVSVGRD